VEARNLTARTTRLTNIQNEEEEKEKDGGSKARRKETLAATLGVFA